MITLQTILDKSENHALDEWVGAGGNMLSHLVERGCCLTLGVNGRTLRSTKLIDIFQVSTYGEIARREISRFAKENA